MDPITEFVFGINNGLLTEVSLLVNSEMVFVAMLLAALLFGEKRNSKRLKILSTALLAVAVGLAIKMLIAAERPCVALAMPYCPFGYSFPSLHALAAFTLMIAFLNKRSFVFYLFFALFVSFTRLAIAAHTFRDIAAALPIAIIVYYVVDLMWVKFYAREHDVEN